MTGSLRAPAGRQMFSWRQSSDGCSATPPATSAGRTVCGQAGPSFAASRTPRQRGGACGARQRRAPTGAAAKGISRSEEHTSELQSLMRISDAVFCLKKNKKKHETNKETRSQSTTTEKSYTI